MGKTKGDENVLIPKGESIYIFKVQKIMITTDSWPTNVWTIMQS